MKINIFKSKKQKQAYKYELPNFPLGEYLLFKNYKLLQLNKKEFVLSKHDNTIIKIFPKSFWYNLENREEIINNFLSLFDEKPHFSSPRMEFWWNRNGKNFIKKLKFIKLWKQLD